MKAGPIAIVRSVALMMALASAAQAAVPARAMYTEALAREQRARAALADRPRAAALKAVHDVVAVYEAIVDRYPASGYSDNALWQAGRLSLDAYLKYGDLPDKRTGVRLLNDLASQYPSSSLVKAVPAELARADDRPVETARADDRPVQTAPARIVTLESVRRTVLPDVVRVTIELNAEVPFHDERLNNPERVFLDLPATRAAAPLQDQTIRFEGDDDVVRQVRIGRHPNSTTRVVLDAAGVSSYSVYPLYEPYRLVIDCVRAPGARASLPPQPSTPARFGRPLPPPVLRARRLSGGWAPAVPGVAPRDAVALADAREAIAAVAEPPAAVPTTPPVKNLAGGFSMARQLGLGISRIVIDPGHGGHDPGAKGKGVTEAELVLDVALRLEKLLKKAPGVDVILTRRTDEFIPLPERTAIANREGADLFLSIHANASESGQARGVETYFLNFANNLSEAAVAARENAASGQAMGALPDFVKAIALSNKLDESRDFATLVQRAMIERLRPANRSVKDLGVKQAPFVVLIGAAMPSVLAEISFVTNAQDARYLKSGGYRERIAEALASAVRRYQTSLHRVTAVAHQNDKF